MSDIAIRVDLLSKLYPAVAPRACPESREGARHLGPPSSAMTRCATRCFLVGTFQRCNVPTFQRGSLGAQDKAARGAGSQSDPELILRPGSGPARTSAARERRDASRGHTAPAVCAGVHRAEINRKFDEIVAFAEIERFLDATHR